MREENGKLKQSLHKALLRDLTNILTQAIDERMATYQKDMDEKFEKISKRQDAIELTLTSQAEASYATVAGPPAKKNAQGAIRRSKHPADGLGLRRAHRRTRGDYKEGN